MSPRRIPTLLALASLYGSSALGQTIPRVPYNHFDYNDNRFYTVDVAVGAYFEVEVADTCANFQIGFVGVPPGERQTIAREEQNPFRQIVRCVVESEPRVQQIPHSAVFAGYDVRITRRDSDVAPIRAIRLADGVSVESAEERFNEIFMEDDRFDDFRGSPAGVDLDLLNQAFSELGDFKDLGNVELRVAVSSPAWVTAFAGGFSVADVIDPQFAIEGEDDSRILIQDSAAEDSVSIGLVSFIHLSPMRPRWGKSFALSFGLGLSADNEPSYYFGPSWRMGQQGYLTFGVNWREVDRLPNGQSIGSAPINESVLSNLSTKMDSGLFLSWTYPFLGKGKEVFDKPFNTIGNAPDEGN